VGKFLIAERLLGLVARTVDVVMIYFIWTDPIFGPMKAFVIGVPMNFAISATVVYINEIFVRSGYDVTGLEELRQMAHTTYQKKQYVKRFVSWILRRQMTIFLIGSWFYLDPDYVTLLLQERKNNVWSNIWKITFPSVILAMLVWTPVYWGAYQGFRWAVWAAF